MESITPAPQGPGNARVEPGFASTEPAAAHERPLKIRFTGSGSEYFRIWIVNLLLTIVTLSLYRPWAKVRRLKYFYANTLVDEHAFDFHGDPRKMLRGYLLVGLMLVCYSAAGHFSRTGALVALLIVAVLWPALLRASMQFRLANTSWRGLRFHFSGTLEGAYRAMLPMFVPAVVLGVLGLGIDDPRHPPSWYLPAFGLTMLGVLLLAPLVWWNFKRFQHDHFCLGQWRTQLKVGPGSVYGLAVKLLAVSVICGLAVGIVMAVVAAIAGVMAGGTASWAHNRTTAMVVGMAFGLAFYFFALMVPVPYAISRSQNLVWGHTGCDEVRFESKLPLDSMVGLTVKNWLLMVLTLGLYYPFAVVASYRLRVQAITPHLSGDLDRLQAQAAARVTDASGDAAGDLFGIDIGL